MPQNGFHSGFVYRHLDGLPGVRMHTAEVGARYQLTAYVHPGGEFEAVNVNLTDIYATLSFDRDRPVHTEDVAGHEPNWICRHISFSDTVGDVEQLDPAQFDEAGRVIAEAVYAQIDQFVMAGRELATA
ncbi:hypothetical protein [Mycobacteroides abscessus]|uniref:hypothetical protein n=1 Tax=Mycobacteroides abscessus TaxID=36809 RepID=UPI00266FD8A4|nr:hypothetical protein [Mycobacteroides abscessus]MDO3110446.1 hypothetical protein [Mycobacteroides abscessus subsp. abscessus]